MRALLVLFAFALTACRVTVHAEIQPLPPPSPGASAGSRPDARQEAQRRSFEIHVVDVGTGLAVLVAGEDFTLVYDAGSNDDTALGDSNRFIAYLRAVKPGLTDIDHVVLSHPHRDHVELLADVITRYHVRDVWDSGAINPMCGYRRFIDAISRSPGLRYHSGAADPGEHALDFGKECCSDPPLAATATVRHAARLVEGSSVTLGKKAQMTFLHVDGERRGERYNENTLVALLDLDGTRALFMGDAEAGGREPPSKPPTSRSVEGHVLASYRAQIDADILIVGHHGSKSSSREAFIQAVTPRISVISAGPTQYQSVTLPDSEIVDELKRAGQLFRTDNDDAACAREARKIGPDADNKPGGCDNVQIEIRNGKVRARYAHIAD